MADEAAKKMKEKAYSKKIDEAYEKLDAMGEELVRKYIPAPVIACVNEYGNYFGNLLVQASRPSRSIPTDGRAESIAYL